MSYRNRQSNRTRNVKVEVYVTYEEKLQIQQNMITAGTSNFSAYARKMLLDGYIIKVDFSELRQLISHLGRIGNNINQIARVANSSGKVAAKEVAALQAEWQKLKAKLSESIIKLLRTTNDNKL